MCIMFALSFVYIAWKDHDIGNINVFIFILFCKLSYVDKSSMNVVQY